MYEISRELHNKPRVIHYDLPCLCRSLVYTQRGLYWASDIQYKQKDIFFLLLLVFGQIHINVNILSYPQDTKNDENTKTQVM